MLGISVTLTKEVFVYLCFCVRQMGTLFLSFLYHYLFKNIAFVRHICNFDRSCICVFVYLHIKYLGTLFLRSLYHYLSENIWFVWSKTLVMHWTWNCKIFTWSFYSLECYKWFCCYPTKMVTLEMLIKMQNFHLNLNLKLQDFHLILLLTKMVIQDFHLNQIYKYTNTQIQL